MKQIQELIDEMCHEGVEYKKLGDVCDVKTGKTIGKKAIAEESGPFPVINSGKEPLGFVNKWNENDNPIGIASRGSVGHITWTEGKFFRGGLNYGMNNLDKAINQRYLYHALLQNQHQIYSLCNFNGIPALNASELKKVVIPVPPLPVQEAIVEYLDKFTELEAELEAELVRREKQNEWYRTHLLDFKQQETKEEKNTDGSIQNISTGKILDYQYADEYTPRPLVEEVRRLVDELCPDGVEYKRLGDVGEFIRGSGLTKKDLTDSGQPVIHYGQIYTKYGFAAKSTFNYTSEKVYSKLKKASTGDLIIASTSENVDDLCKTIVWEGNEIGVSGDSHIYKHSLNPRYIGYIFSSIQFRRYKQLHSTGVKVKRLSSNDMEKFIIPVPPLPVQEKIVEILDNFNTLINDMESGIPAEIKSRRKQQEYYRERLLSFKEKDAVR